MYWQYVALAEIVSSTDAWISFRLMELPLFAAIGCSDGAEPVRYEHLSSSIHTDNFFVKLFQLPFVVDYSED
jgi:hypothetical protein